MANGINTVHLAYARESTGYALIGALEWIPAGQIRDLVTSAVAGLPADLLFRTKGQLAIDILTKAIADGVLLDFVYGGEVYGSCTGLREFCEGRDQAYGCVAGLLQLPAGPVRRPHAHLEQATARLGRLCGWEVRSAGSGSKGDRWYAWVWLATASWRHHVLIRRQPGVDELAYHCCYPPEGQPASPSRPIGAAGRDMRSASKGVLGKCWAASSRSAAMAAGRSSAGGCPTSGRCTDWSRCATSG